jgi:hypothetical protein
MPAGELATETARCDYAPAIIATIHVAGRAAAVAAARDAGLGTAST